MRDPYKVKVITEEIEKAEKDEYYLVRLKGDTGKTINMDRNVLELIRAYYMGKLSEEDIEKICRG